MVETTQTLESDILNVGFGSTTWQLFVYKKPPLNLFLNSKFGIVIILVILDYYEDSFK